MSLNEFYSCAKRRITFGFINSLTIDVVTVPVIYGDGWPIFGSGSGNENCWKSRSMILFFLFQ